MNLEDISYVKLKWQDSEKLIKDETSPYPAVRFRKIGLKVVRNKGVPSWLCLKIGESGNTRHVLYEIIDKQKFMLARIKHGV